MHLELSSLHTGLDVIADESSSNMVTMVIRGLVPLRCGGFHLLRFMAKRILRLSFRSMSCYLWTVEVLGLDGVQLHMTRYCFERLRLAWRR